jgi:proteasome lid subunit RPN8/RPN11
VRIGHIEPPDAEGEDFLFHFLRVIGFEFQIDSFQKIALIENGVLVDKAEVRVTQLKAVHFIATSSAEGRTQEQTSQGDIYPSPRLVVTVQGSHSGPPHKPLAAQLDIAQFFSGLTPGAHIIISTPTGRKLLQLPCLCPTIRIAMQTSTPWIAGTITTPQAATLLGQKLKLKILCERLLIISLRFFGILPLCFHPLADGTRPVLSTTGPETHRPPPQNLQLKIFVAWET